MKIKKFNIVIEDENFKQHKVEIEAESKGAAEVEALFNLHKETGCKGVVLVSVEIFDEDVEFNSTVRELKTGDQFIFGNTELTVKDPFTEDKPLTTESGAMFYYGDLPINKVP